MSAFRFGSIGLFIVSFKREFDNMFRACSSLCAVSTVDTPNGKAKQSDNRLEAIMVPSDVVNQMEEGFSVRFYQARYFVQVMHFVASTFSSFVRYLL